MKCRKIKSVGGLQTGATIANSIGSTALAVAPFTGPAAPFVAAAGGIINEIGAGLNLGATRQQNKIDNLNALRNMVLQDYNINNQTPDKYNDYIPTLNANYKMGGCRYRNRLGGQVKYKRKSC